MNRHHFFPMVFTLLSAWVYSNVTFEISPRQVPLNRNLEFSIIVEGNQSRTPSFPNGLHVNGFQLLSQSPSTSFSTSIINGQMSAQRSFIYYFKPLKEGEFTFPEQNVNVDGTLYKSSPVTIKVVAAETEVRNSRRRNSLFDDFFSNPMGQTRQSSREPEIFAELRVPQRTYYQGEAIPVEVHLVFFGIEIHPQRSSMEWPNMTDFWIEDGASPNQPAKRVELNGKYYNESMVGRRIVYANKSGDLTIGPAVFNLMVSTGGFMADWQNVKRQTKPLTLKVLPLPEEGKPVDFSGAVGSFKLRAELDRQELSVGETLSLKVILEGDGNFSAIQKFPLEALKEQFEIFDGGAPTVEEQAGRVNQKTWVYALVPKQEGEFEIPPLSFNFFDIGKKKYQTVESEGFKVVVKPGSRLPEQVGLGRDNSLESMAQKEDQALRFIKFDSEGWIAKSRTYYSPKWLYLLAGFAIFGNLLFLVVRKMKESWMGKKEELKPLFAQKEFRSQVKKLKKRLGESDPTFFADLSTALMDYFGAKFGRPGQGLLLDEIEAFLLSKNAHEALFPDLVSCIESCDLARFTPSSNTSRDKLLALATRVVDQAEEVFK